MLFGERWIRVLRQFSANRKLTQPQTPRPLDSVLPFADTQSSIRERRQSRPPTEQARYGGIRDKRDVRDKRPETKVPARLCRLMSGRHFVLGS